MTENDWHDFNQVRAQLVRAVIHAALKDTADCHWRVADTTAGEQLVRVRDLLAWAELTASNLEKADDD